MWVLPACVSLYHVHAVHRKKNKSSDKLELGWEAVVSLRESCEPGPSGRGASALSPPLAPIDRAFKQCINAAEEREHDFWCLKNLEWTGKKRTACVQGPLESLNLQLLALEPKTSSPGYSWSPAFLQALARSFTVYIKMGTVYLWSPSYP